MQVMLLMGVSPLTLTPHHPLTPAPSPHSPFTLPSPSPHSPLNLEMINNETGIRNILQYIQYAGNVDDGGSQPSPLPPKRVEHRGHRNY